VIAYFTAASWAEATAMVLLFGFAAFGALQLLFSLRLPRRNRFR
jgi:hypothetical protein